MLDLKLSQVADVRLGRASEQQNFSLRFNYTPMLLGLHKSRTPKCASNLTSSALIRGLFSLRLCVSSTVCARLHHRLQLQCTMWPLTHNNNQHKHTNPIPADSSINPSLGAVIHVNNHGCIRIRDHQL
mmetsp:Transcript_9476/g.15060  ORF Transcript_9476/g.15060 Transcript_9476/m.15060 type:complete len:128 (+) Transcript_9476:216-599(+)